MICRRRWGRSFLVLQTRGHAFTDKGVDPVLNDSVRLPRSQRCEGERNMKSSRVLHPQGVAACNSVDCTVEPKPTSRKDSGQEQNKQPDPLSSSSASVPFCTCCSHCVVCPSYLSELACPCLGLRTNEFKFCTELSGDCTSLFLAHSIAAACQRLHDGNFTLFNDTRTLWK